MIEQQIAEGVGSVLRGESGVVTVLGLLCLALGYIIYKLDSRDNAKTERLISITVENNKVISAFTEKLDEVIRNRN